MENKGMVLIDANSVVYPLYTFYWWMM